MDLHLAGKSSNELQLIQQSHSLHDNLLLPTHTPYVHVLITYVLNWSLCSIWKYSSLYITAYAFSSCLHRMLYVPYIYWLITYLTRLHHQVSLLKRFLFFYKKSYLTISGSKKHLLSISGRKWRLMAKLCIFFCTLFFWYLLLFVTPSPTFSIKKILVWCSGERCRFEPVNLWHLFHADGCIFINCRYIIGNVGRRGIWLHTHFTTLGYPFPLLCLHSQEENGGG